MVANNRGIKVCVNPFGKLRHKTSKQSKHKLRPINEKIIEKVKSHFPELKRNIEYLCLSCRISILKYVQKNTVLPGEGSNNSASIFGNPDNSVRCNSTTVANRSPFTSSFSFDQIEVQTTMDGSLTKYEVPTINERKQTYVKNNATNLFPPFSTPSSNKTRHWKKKGIFIPNTRGNNYFPSKRLIGCFNAVMEASSIDQTDHTSIENPDDEFLRITENAIASPLSQVTSIAPSEYTDIDVDLEKINSLLTMFAIQPLQIVGRQRKVAMIAKNKFNALTDSIANLFNRMAGSQYKCIKNFVNLAYFESDFHVQAEWIFTATAHGKSYCDAQGGTTKRSARLESMKKDTFILNPLDLYLYCSKSLTSPSSEYIYASKGQVEQEIATLNLEERYKLCKTITGTRDYHSFLPISNNEIQVRKFSSSLLSTNVKLNKNAIFPYKCGQYIVFHLCSKPCIGVIIEIEEIGGDVTVNVLKQLSFKNQFQWPDLEHKIWVPIIDIVEIVENPTATTKAGRVFEILPTHFKLFSKK